MNLKRSLRGGAHVEVAGDRRAVALVLTAEFDVHEIALLENAVRGEAVGIAGALTRDEIHWARSRVAAGRHHGTVGSCGDFPFGGTEFQGGGNGVHPDIGDLCGLSDMGELGRGFDELQAFDQVGRIADLRVRQCCNDLEVIVSAQIVGWHLEADPGVVITLLG